MTKSKAQKAKAAQGAKKGGGGMSRVSAPVATARKGKVATAAKIAGNPYAPGGSMRVSHREYIGEVLGSTSVFLNTKYPINPGMAVTFPWLSSVASDFEEYSFSKLAFHYEPEKPTSAAGYVMMAIDYDPADAVPTTKQQLAAALGAVRTPVWSNVRDDAASSQLKKQQSLYLRSGTLASNLDIKTYDQGFLNIAVGNCADATFIGELWVEYDVTFRVPQLNQSAELIASSLAIAGGGTISLAAPFGTVPVYIGGLDIAASAATLTFNTVGSFLVMVPITGTVIVSASVPVYTGTAAATSHIAMRITTAATAGVFSFTVQVTARGQTVIIDLTGDATTVTASNAYISSYLVS